MEKIEREQLLNMLLTELLTKVQKRILIVLSGGNVHMEHVLTLLSEASHHDYDIVITERGKEIIESVLIKQLHGRFVETYDELETSVRKVDVVLIPIMSRNTLSKSAVGISDNLVTTGISQALMMAKEVIAVKDSFDPNQEVNIAKGLSNNFAYNEMIQNHLKVLQSLGMKFVNLAEFSTLLKNNLHTEEVTTLSHYVSNKELVSPETEIKKKVTVSSTILTLTDINMLNTDQKIVLTNKNTIITPLAKDFIRKNQISIEYST